MIAIAGYRFELNKATIVCEHVFGGGNAELFVHDSDGDIQVLCGAPARDWDKARVICLSEALESLPSRDLPTIEPGFVAEWNGDGWIVERAE